MPKKDIDIAPQDDETYEDFLDRCLEETDGDNFTCDLAWEERSVKKKVEVLEVVRKTHVTEGGGQTFVLSDATPDRMGDVIEASGWDLRNFKKNPVALFNHNSNFPIGKWNNLRVENGELRGHLQLAPEGTSDRIDEIRRLVDADILRAVSVGFLPRKHEPIGKNSDGMRFTAAELVETSLVAIPANPNALAVARSLNISRDTVAMVFAGKGNEKDQSIERRGFNGGQAELKPVTKRTPTMSGPLSKRIEDTQQRIVALRDQLTAHLEAVDDENVTDADLATTQELNKKIADQEALLKASLKDSEAQAGEDAVGEWRRQQLTIRTVITKTGERRPFSARCRRRWSRLSFWFAPERSARCARSMDMSHRCRLARRSTATTRPPRWSAI